MTVPASLEAGKSGDVTLKGKWPSNKTFTVSADKTVTMTCDIGGSQALNVTFAGIELAGSNTVEVSETKQVSVDSMTALFGNWSGTFKYNLNSTGGSSSSGSDDDEDWSDAVEFTVTSDNRAAVGYTGAENEELVIPAYFVGDGENETTEGTKYKVTSIGDCAFYNCGNLTSVTIPDGVTNIGDNAFNGCTSLTSIIIPESITNIGHRMFYNCENLTSITIPKSVTSIRDSAFYGCASLTSITIPSSVTSIGNSTLYFCKSLLAINVDANNSAYKSVDGMLFTKNGETLVQYPAGKIGAYTIPDSVINIDYYAFASCPNLTGVTIPSSVTSIKSDAFCNCSRLTSITFTGTQEQWNAIAKDSGWNILTGNYTIHCTDGDIAKS